MKRVGVTGAAGFIGSHLCDRLVSEGIEVVGVDDLSRGTLGNLETCLDEPAVHVRAVRLHAAAPRLRSAFDGCDAIVHLAAQKIPRYEGALMTLESNVAGVNAAAMRRALDRRRPRWSRRRRTSTATATPPFAEDDDAGARPADEPALGVRRLEAVRRARLPRPRGGARPARHDPALLRLLRPAQPPELVGRPAGGVLRDAARRRA